VELCSKPRSCDGEKSSARSRLRISFFVHDLAANPIVRAAPLARALEQECDIEIVGFLLSGSEVYEPFRDSFEYKTLRCSLNVNSVLGAIPLLASFATGDVVYACKPLLTSMGPALFASVRQHKPFLLDAEDDEWIPAGTSSLSFVWRDLIKGWRHATAWKYTRLIHPLSSLARAVTVSSSKLKARYGGTIIRHGPDESQFDPRLPLLLDISACRRAFSLPEGPFLALFAGMPQPHKGLPILISALEQDQSAHWELVLAGPSEHPDFELAAARLGRRCHRVGLIPNNLLPRLLTAVDAVPVPQRRVPFAESQLPAKILEAMAMAKPVIAARVGDIPNILGDGARGWLFEPEDVFGLSRALEEVSSDPMEARRRGEAARAWFLENAGTDAIREQLRCVLRRVCARGLQTSG
jgi:glycosyltransferase involved in cell wall biosynthesis